MSAETIGAAFNQEFLKIPSTKSAIEYSKSLLKVVKHTFLRLGLRPVNPNPRLKDS